jgi:hypothetical protein
MVLLILLVVLVGGGVLLVRFAKSLEPRERLALIVAVILVAAYFLPKMIQGAMRGYRAGAEIAQRQGR